ncbi:hypothetical protein [Microbacterium phage MO526]|uniref:site-specific DNA-methyltransferase (adenine-specific) n=1 Tax=Microbacterium phage MO526 TaxID=3108092 RepID=A0ABZ0ZZ09_9CAUD|nr:hypothetical protein [Microbacterium phage MO526]
MRYLGGKGRIADDIAATIHALNPDAPAVVEPFMGGASVTAALAARFPEVRASDAHPDIAALWSAVLDGWTPPTEITPAVYEAMRLEPEPSALRGFVGFGGSYGGAYFSAYARGGERADGTPRNHQAESARAVTRIGRALRAGHVTVALADYRAVTVNPGEVVYCDPPYAGTAGYSTGPFDSTAFWAWAHDLAAAGADVYVSEYTAPRPWQAVWATTIRQSLSPASTRTPRRERLYRLNRERIDAVATRRAALLPA